MNVSQIKYRTIGKDEILIEDFQGVASLSEIREEFGSGVRNKYIEGKRYFRLGRSIIMKEERPGRPSFLWWCVGRLFLKVSLPRASLL